MYCITRLVTTVALCTLLISLVGAHSSEKHLPPTITHMKLMGNEASSVTPATSTLQTSGDWVDVAWNAPLASPNSNLTISLYSPAANVANYSTKAPIKWTAPLNDTQGTYSFQLTNLRTDYAFVLLENSAIIAISTPVSFANVNEPLQVHIALSSQCSTCVNIMWNTLNSQNPMVKWGTQSGVYTQTASAQSHTYTANDVCGDPAQSYGWSDPGTFHEAVIELQSSELYYYVVGDEQYGWTEERTVRGPRVANSSETVAFLAYGDMGKREADMCVEHWAMPGSLITSSILSSIVMNYSYDTILHIGDISYAVGYGAQWDTYFRLIEPFASVVPYMTSPGNHESDFMGFGWLNGTDSGGECGVSYRNRFHMPVPDDGPAYYTNRTGNWYSFDMGPVHVIMMDTEERFDSLEEGQLQFIAEDLASVDRQVTPFIIFNGHRPMYVSSTSAGSASSDQGMAILLRKYVEPLLHQYQVDIALWGHVHAYQRSCAVYNLTCVDDGTVHVIIGMGGASLSSDVQTPTPDFTVYFDYEHFGYANITVTPSLLHLQYISNDLGGAILDEVYIKSKF